MYILLSDASATKAINTPSADHAAVRDDSKPNDGADQPRLSKGGVSFVIETGIGSFAVLESPNAATYVPSGETTEPAANACSRLERGSYVNFPVLRLSSPGSDELWNNRHP